MRPDHPRPLLVGLFLILPALFTLLSPGGRLSVVEGVDAQSLEPTERWTEGRQALDEQRYRDAHELLAGLTAVDDVAPRELDLVQAEAGLRWALLRGGDEQELLRESSARLARLVETEDDRAAALALAVLADTGMRSESVQAHLGRVLAFWESSTDIARDRDDYAALARILSRQGSWVGPGENRILRMWENLVAAELEPPALESLAIQILTGQPTMPDPRTAWRVFDRGGRSPLRDTVAQDVLRLGASPWLRMQAHGQLGYSARSEQRFDLALDHFEKAVDLIPPENSEFSRQLVAQIERIREPAALLSGFALYRPGSPHEMKLEWRNLSSWTLTVRRIDPQRDVRLVLEESEVGDPANFVDPKAGEVVITRSQNDATEQAARAAGASPAQRHQPRSKLLRFDALDPGVYLVQVDVEPFEGDAAPTIQPKLIVVTRYGVLEQTIHDAQDDRDELHLWAVAMDDADVASNVKLQVHRATRSRVNPRQRTLEWTREVVTTDGDGRAAIVLTGDADRRHLLVTGEVDGHPIFFASPSWYRGTAPDTQMARGFVWSDRTLYRPGETVRLQGFVRNLDTAARTVDVPRDKSARLEIYDPRGQSYFEQDVRLDENGSTDLDLTIGADAPLGRYNVQLWTQGRSRLVSGGFQVDEFRLPEFRVSVALDTDRRYVLGDTLEVDVQAEYLFGGAVRGEAEVVVRRETVWNFWQPWVRMPWIGQAPYRSEMKVFPPGGHGSGMEVLRTTVSLDESGAASLSIPTDRRASESGDFRYVIEARVTDTSRREETGQGAVTVGRQELTAFLSNARTVVAPGDRAELTLRIQDAMGRGVAHEVQSQLFFHEKDRPERLLRAGSVSTDQEGQAKLEFIPERVGSYRFVATGVDGRGFPIEASTVVWVADPKTTDLPLLAGFADGGLQLVVASDEQLGETAQVLLLTDAPGKPIWLTRTHAGGSEVEMLRPAGTAQLLEIAIDDLHRPSFEIHVMRPYDWRVIEDRVQVSVPAAKRIVDLELEYNEDVVEPGRQVPLSIRATDALGQPVQTVLSIAVVDQGVLQLLPREGLDPVRMLHEFPTRYAPRPTLLSSRLGSYVWLETADDDMELGGNLPRPSVDGEYRSDMVKARPGELYVRGGRDGDVSFAVEAAPMAAGRMVADEMVGSGTPSITSAEIRTDFRLTALWQLDVATDADGRAVVDVPLAESLTEWNTTVLALDPQSRTGIAETTIRTRKPVMVRLNHPRVFRERDSFVAVATVHNEFDDPIEALVQLDAEDLPLEGRTQRVLVPAHGETRVEWKIAVPSDRLQPEVIRDDLGRIVATVPASVKLTVAVESALGSDAFERTVPLLAFGSGAHFAAIGEIGAGEHSLEIELPGDRVPGTDTVFVTVNPSLLSTCVEALSYLADYPYGCTEQTLSRFVPAVSVRAAARALGVSSERIDPELDEKIAAGLARIAAQQNDDGGWGWFDRGRDNPYVTAYVVMALARAERDGVDVDRRVLQQGREALRRVVASLESRPDDLAYALFALAQADEVLNSDGRARIDDTQLRWVERLVDDRDDLTAYARALTARVAHRYRMEDRAELVLRHLENDVRRDRKLGTAHWGRTSGYWWRGFGAVEATAFALGAFTEIAPDHELRNEAARWLAYNRRGHRWDSTRSTAHAIFALTDHLTAGDQPRPDYTLVVSHDDAELLRVRVTPEQLLDAGGRFSLPAEILRDGRNRLDLRLEGEGTAWVAYEVDTFTQVDEIEAAGNVIEVTREIVRLVPRRTLGRGIVEFEEPVFEGHAVESGDRLRVRLTITARHDVDFVMIDDPRIAGCEPVEGLSGPFSSGGLWGRREVRDARTVFFVDSLAEGEHVLEYEVRAESPGEYRVGPARAMGMYLPDVSGHSGSGAVAVTGASEGP